jgi:hypothetical protein
VNTDSSGCPDEAIRKPMFEQRRSQRRRRFRFSSAISALR